MKKETPTHTTPVVEELKPNTPPRRRRTRGIFSIGRQTDPIFKLRSPFSVHYPS